MLAALACVDFVTLFAEPTPEALLERIRPNLHVKGGDYTPETMPETPVVVRNGGRVVVLPLTPGRSTTDLIARMLSAQGPSL
jgi:bifunctional ADP-heptose synthase (sugar kinase/adenylyltransferase)